MTKNSRRRLALQSTVSILLLFGCCRVADAAIEKLEQTCARKLGRASARLNSKAIKSVSKCRDADISGKLVGSCPNADTNITINRASTRLLLTVDKSCGSTCSVTRSIGCLADSFCPAAGDEPEDCDGTGAANGLFDLANLGFPGAFCESIVGGPITVKSELSTCVDTVSRAGADEFIDLIYGSAVNATGVSPEAASCLASISKASAKLVSTIVKRIGKCRVAINKGKVLGDPIQCRVEDTNLAASVARADQKLRETIFSKCQNGYIVQLDLCGNGIGGTADIAAAQDCISQAVDELADSALLPSDRVYSSVSIVEAAYPPQPSCGDDVVNQGKTSELPLGEECDGTDMGGCAGNCAPPGDVFQCTCDDTPRAKLFLNYIGNIGTDTDAGWTGLSHNQKLAQDSGYTTTLENCNCGGFTDATCTGGSSDPVCDAVGAQLPVCSGAPESGLRCDADGDGNGADEDSDCWVCDSLAANAGAYCSSGLDCQSQCYDGGAATRPCSSQIDCGGGEICQGRCDTGQVCNFTFDGGPLAVNTAGTAVCTVQLYKEAVTGTRNIVTGEHELNYQLLARVHTAESNFRPCPVCGGFCVGGKNDLRVCQGRCSGGAAAPCRFDSECPGSETCLEASPDCPGGSCELSLVCGAKESENPGLTGTPCRIDYTDPLYGSLSNDCPPYEGKNITGTGLVVDFYPSTHAQLTLPSGVPCTSPGFELLDCPCPDGGGAGTAPNSCAPACNAGAELGVGCAVGNTSGDGTKCSAGVNAGRICDEDSDCPGGACSVNPTHCLGDPSFDRFLCTTNADCGTGTCEDACPSGRCLPLCLPDPADSEDGLCADGPPAYHCAGPLFQFISCNSLAANGSCTATCSMSGGTCSNIDDCPPGEICNGPCLLQQYCEAGNDGSMGTSDDQEGAGACVADMRSCFLDPLVGEGGSTINGKGDHTDWFSVGMYCFDGTLSPAINTDAGFGGPGRTRRKGTNVVNVPSIP